MQWHEDGEFWATFASFIFSEERLASAPQEVEQVLALAAVPVRSVLDLGCGVGRHAIAFAQRGYRVTGVDRTSASLDRARAHASRIGADVEFVESDMRAFTRPGAFDLAVSLFTSFGYFDTTEEELRVLGNVREALRPGGAFVIDVMGKEVLARIFQDTHSAVTADGTLMIWRNAITDDWTRVKGEWHAIRDGRARSFTVTHWLYSGRELRSLLLEAGFRDARLFGGFDGRPYDASATRLVAVAGA